MAIGVDLIILVYRHYKQWFLHRKAAVLAKYIQKTSEFAQFGTMKFTSSQSINTVYVKVLCPCIIVLIVAHY